MEPLTITIGIVAGAVANALAGPKRRYKGGVGALPGESAVPGAVGIDWSRYRLRSRAQPAYAPYPSFRACPQGTQWDSRLNRCAPQPRAQAAPGAATTRPTNAAVPPTAIDTGAFDLSRLNAGTSYAFTVQAGNETLFDGPLSGAQIRQAVTNLRSQQGAGVLVKAMLNRRFQIFSGTVPRQVADNMRRLFAAMAA